MNYSSSQWRRAPPQASSELLYCFDVIGLQRRPWLTLRFSGVACSEPGFAACSSQSPSMSTTGAMVSQIVNSSIEHPASMAACNHFGLRPRPLQVSPVAWLRYFGATLLPALP